MTKHASYQLIYDEPVFHQNFSYPKTNHRHLFVVSMLSTKTRHGGDGLRWYQWISKDPVFVIGRGELVPFTKTVVIEDGDSSYTTTNKNTGGWG
jgi:hypothetical protein